MGKAGQDVWFLIKPPTEHSTPISNGGVCVFLLSTVRASSDLAEPVNEQPSNLALISQRWAQ